MAEGKGKKDDFLWWVQCEGHYDVPVIAPNWELATVEAAHLWGVPWAKVAARCELREKLPVVRNVCQRCGKIFPRPRPAVRRLHQYHPHRGAAEGRRQKGLLPAAICRTLRGRARDKQTNRQTGGTVR